MTISTQRGTGCGGPEVKTQKCMHKYYPDMYLILYCMFIIKYNVFDKYIINVTTTEINTCKKIFEFGQREVISFMSTAPQFSMLFLFKINN
jgi:hypothetical protein